MRLQATYQIQDVLKFKNQLSIWASQFQTAVILSGETDSLQGKYLEYNFIAGVDVLSEITPKKNLFNELQKMKSNISDWLFGYFSYDLKNELEDLKSENHDGLVFPELYFFQPKWVFLIKDNEVILEYPSSIERSVVHKLFSEILSFKEKKIQVCVPVIKSRINKKRYLELISKIKEHIQLGDIYEINFCQEFYSEGSIINPMNLFQKLYQISKAPFSCYFRIKDLYIMSASPERFLKRMGDKIISQPIKGTSKRGDNPSEDDQLKKQLYESNKERTENVMVVDLVRNDLSKTAAKSSVNVEELFGVYSFKQVHQMISTISSRIKKGIHSLDVIKGAFPMGSMTGMPKISAMELIEKYETTKRGVYSGSIGYFTPEGDFDFNVVIRSILYNSRRKYASFMVGGAITFNSDSELEYEECLLKAKALFKVLEDDR